MSELQYVASINVPFRPPGRNKGFRVSWIPRGTRVPADHPAVQQMPEHFRPATAKDLTMFVGFKEYDHEEA